VVFGRHYNMNRIRLVWSRMWAVLADYFVTIGCMDNLSVAMYAIDSLRQLAMKFLEREELANYNFQNEFLKPFVVVMRRTGSVEIRELIIRCVSQMVFTRVANVKSGWKIMFMVRLPPSPPPPSPPLSSSFPAQPPRPSPWACPAPSPPLISATLTGAPHQALQV